MARTEQLGQAGLVGWREKVADRVAPAAAQRGPLSEEQIRALVGALFFALSAYYVVSTCVRMVRGERPVMYCWDRRDRLSVIAGLGYTGVALTLDHHHLDPVVHAVHP